MAGPREPGKEPMGSFWHKMLIVMCVGCILLFSFFVLMDMANVMTRVKARCSNPIQELNSQQFSKASIPLKDDETCVARTQHLLYRKDPQRFTASAELDAAWKRYGELHRACSFQKNLTHAFLHERKMKAHDDCNYLIMIEGAFGLGNHFLSLISAFTYALATDRVFLIDSRSLFAKLLCNPFPDSSWLLPVDFPYKEAATAPAFIHAIDSEFRDVDLLCLHLEHVQISLLKKMGFSSSQDAGPGSPAIEPACSILGIDQSWGDSQFFCDQNQLLLMDVQWLGWLSNQYFVTRLLMIPSLWERLHPIFPSTEDQVFFHLSHRLLLPHNDIWAHILREYWSYISGSRTRVGLQIRLHGRKDPGAFDEEVLERILQCLQSEKVLPELVEKENIEALSGFFLKRREGEFTSADIAVLVASLQIRFYESLRDSYGAIPNAESAMIRFHTVSHLGRQDYTVQQAQIAFVEMWLLSFSDVLLTSPYSTFGYIPQAIGGLKPFILNIQGDNITANGPQACFRGQSMEPCTHFPQKLACRGSKETAEHSNWIQNHIKECQDKEGGLQLVDHAEDPSSAQSRE